MLVVMVVYVYNGVMRDPGLCNCIQRQLINWVWMKEAFVLYSSTVTNMAMVRKKVMYEQALKDCDDGVDFLTFWTVYIVGNSK
jgi:quinol-cytochrome oxidoreductase complex cytochrome b subunit